MGLELLASLGIKMLPYLLGAVALIAVYLGIKRKGVKEERARQTAADQAAELDTQHRLADARSKDAEVDARTQDAIEKARQRPPSQPKPDRFQFVWPFILALLLVGCAAVAVAPVPPDIPSRPVLEACPIAPHPTAGVRGNEVILQRPDAEAIADFLARAPACYTAREQQLLGHIEKLENRLKALGGK